VSWRTVTILASLATALVLAAPAQAADVTVNFARDGGSKTVSLSSLAGSFDVNQDYALIGTSGQTTTKQISGISLRALLTAVGADPAYSAVTIARPGGGAVRVSRSQIESSGLTPVVYADGGLATFVRPSYFDGDRNALDVVSAAPLTITQVDGTDYDLKAKVSKSTAKTGQSLSFSASATGAAGQKLIFSWNFDDGSSAQGEKVNHRFKRRGYYRVLVSVRGEGETASVSTVLRVQIGKAVKSKQQREGGGTNDSAGAPLSGGADGAGGAIQAAGAERPAHKRRSKPVSPSTTAGETVTGELLTSPDPNQPQNDVAARTGQQVKPNTGNGGISTQAASAAVALGLLALGALLEMGAAGGLRRRSLSPQ
jgi:hypothetical protein